MTSPESIVRPLTRLLGLVIGLLLGACAVIPHQPNGKQPVALDPPDTRPVFSIEVADDAEVGLLQQQLKLQPLRREDRALYFYEADNLTDRLRQYGYLPKWANAYDVFRRVVRVEHRGSEEELAKLGVNLINREKTYWVVEGTLGSLRALQQAGYRLSPLGANEPRPREVRILLRTRQDVQRIAEMHVDIFSVVQGKEGLVLLGAAFDHQIDRLRAEGFGVEASSTAPQGDPP